MHMKMTLYHKLVIAENVFIEKTKTEPHSTEVKVTLDKMVSFFIYCPVFTHLKR